MYSIFQILARLSGHIVFVVLLLISFYLIVKHNKTQQDIFINTSNLLVGKLSGITYKAQEYFKLGQVNDSLRRENANLIENLIALDYASDVFPSTDSLNFQFSLIPSKVQSMTHYLRNNNIILDKGLRHGVKKDMGVINTQKMVVGVVTSVSENFSKVMSILHSQSKLSVAVKNTQVHGTLVWNSMDPRYVNLESILKHKKISVGDTIVTSGYSTIFPRGMLVGRVEKVEDNTINNYFDIEVKLFSDLSEVRYTYIVKNRFSVEQKELEKSIDDE